MRRFPVLLVIAAAVLAVLATWAGCNHTGGARNGETTPAGATPTHADETAPREPVREHVTTAEPVTPGVSDTHALAVTITRPGGAPVANVEIIVTTGGEIRGTVPRVLCEGVSDAEGHAEVSPPPGSYVVRGVHADLQITGAEVQLPRDRSVRLDAAAGPHVVLVVRDPAGNPIEGAVAWEQHSHCGAIARSDADGRIEFGRVYPHNPYWIVKAPGYARWANYGFGTWDGRAKYEQRVTLRPTFEVSVRVTEHDGSTPGGTVLRYPGGTCTPGPDGTATIDVLPRDDGSWIKATHPDGRSVRQEDVTAESATEVVVMQLPPLDPLRGRVVHAWTGEPVPRAQVLVQPDSESEYTLTANADDHGVFELPHVTRDVRIVAFAPGLARSGTGWTVAEPAEDGTYTIVVAPTMRVTGRVVDKSGEPLTDVSLWLSTYGYGAPMSATRVELRSSADGSFVFDEVPAVPDVIVMAQSRARMAWSAIDLEIPPTPDSTNHVGDIVMPDGFGLDVPVTDDDGNPLANGIVWVRWRIVGQGMPSVHRQVLDGVIDAIDGIPRDGAVAELTAPGCLKTVRRVDASTESLVVDRPCTVQGRVARADGSPVAGVTVRIESKDQLSTLDGNHGSARTQADGTFVVDGIRRARYALRIRTADKQRLLSEAKEIDVRTRDADVGTITVD